MSLNLPDQDFDTFIPPSAPPYNPGEELQPISEPVGPYNHPLLFSDAVYREPAQATPPTPALTVMENATLRSEAIELTMKMLGDQEIDDEQFSLRVLKTYNWLRYGESLYTRPVQQPAHAGQVLGWYTPGNSTMNGLYTPSTPAADYKFPYEGNTVSAF